MPSSPSLSSRARTPERPARHFPCGPSTISRALQASPGIARAWKGRPERPGPDHHLHRLLRQEARQQVEIVQHLDVGRRIGVKPARFEFPRRRHERLDLVERIFSVFVGLERGLDRFNRGGQHAPAGAAAQQNQCRKKDRRAQDLHGETRLTGGRLHAFWLQTPPNAICAGDDLVVRHIPLRICANRSG